MGVGVGLGVGVGTIYLFNRECKFMKC
jgi:hypothetical protein